MKGLLLTLCVVTASAFTGYGQARVGFNNLTPVLNPVTIYSYGGGTVYPGANYSVELLWKAGMYTNLSEFYDANPSNSVAFNFFGSTGGNPSTDGAGLFDGGTVALGGPAGTYTMQVRAWYSTGFSTYDAALAADKNTGRSSLFTVSATAAPTPATNTPVPSFTVGQLPYPPIILAQPQSQSVIIGSNATFIVSVSGLPFPSYQWRKNGSPISGATRFFYSLIGVTTNDAGNYDVSVSNTLHTFMSDVAVLQVGPYKEPPAITQSPLSRTLGAGADTLLSFQLTGDGPFTYQWRLNRSPIPGATNLTLPLTGVTPAQAGLYDVAVTGPGGAVTSAPASVALFGLELAGSSQPSPSLVLDGAPGTSYRLEHSWDLSPANWNLLAPVTLSSNRFYYLDSLDTNRFLRFYRAVPQ